MLWHPTRPTWSASIFPYRRLFRPVRQAVRSRGDAPETDPFSRDGAGRLPVHRFGHIALAVQPSRGYHVDPRSSYHDPALPPPHAYLAFHIWLAGDFGADAVVRSEEHTSELQSLMRISYAVFCLKKKTQNHQQTHTKPTHQTTA